MLRKPTVKALALALGTCTALALTAPSFAANSAISQLRFDHGNFAPAKLSVPANQPFIVKVTNSSDTVIEFESFELHRERVVQPGETITVHMPSLAPGSYPFFDDFHHEVPEGQIISQ